MAEIDLKRLDGENEEQFIWRIGSAKDAGLLSLNWDEIADIINKEFRGDESEYRTEAAYRKRYSQAKQFYDAGVFKELTSENYCKELQEQKRELKKLKQEISDERTDYQRTIRNEARRDSFAELVQRVMERTIAPFERVPGVPVVSDDDMVVCLSDLHAGICIDNSYNYYNVEIMNQRLNSYISQIIDIQNVHHCKVCELVILGDNVSGLIHPNLRLENNENVIEQTKAAITAIGGFVAALRGNFETIRIHSVSGNHSRLSPNKENHQKGENLDALIPFGLSLMFADDKDVEIDDIDCFDESIHYFETRGGKYFYILHGDKDSPDTVVGRMALMNGFRPDGVIMAHRHRNALNSSYTAKVIQSGSVVGTDNHCIDSRIAGEPEQVVFITNGQRTVKCLYDVGL